MASDVEASYAKRATEYVERLGSLETIHPSDEHLATSWAATVDGPLLDAGCGPGQWTAHLASLGSDVVGIDQVAGFVEHARRTHPGVRFRLGTFDALPDVSESYAGVLAWYSLIHFEPNSIHRALREFARILRPGGDLLVGFFFGPEVDAFDHAIVTAYRWSPAALSAELDAVGFDVVEIHTRTGSPIGPRPHGAIVARLRP